MSVLRLLSVLVFVTSVLIGESKNLEISSRIFGGHKASPHSHPYIVVLTVNDVHLCDGSIITNIWILSAGHCVFDENPSEKYHIIAGAHNISEEEETTQRIRVQKFITHPEYKSEVNTWYDIAMLKLTTPLIFNKMVQPINLPEPNSTPTGSCIVSGWGRLSDRPFIETDVLYEVKLYLTPTEVCKKINQDINELFNICVRSNDGRQSCKGDSGGPVVQIENGITTQIGIVSWGEGKCGELRVLDVYLKISSHIDFIESSIKDN